MKYVFEIKQSSSLPFILKWGCVMIGRVNRISTDIYQFKGRGHYKVLFGSKDKQIAKYPHTLQLGTEQ